MQHTLEEIISDIMSHAKKDGYGAYIVPGYLLDRLQYHVQNQPFSTGTEVTFKDMSNDMVEGEVIPHTGVKVRWDITRNEAS